MPLTALAKELGDRPAVRLTEPESALSFRELEERSNQIAHLFRQRGLHVGDHVAVLMGNQLEAFAVAFAALRAGLICTPVNWHLTPAEAAYIVDNSQSKVLIFDVSLEEIAKHCSEVATGLEARFVVGGDVAGAERIERLIADLPTTPITDESEGETMMYSSGTTGRPKGILPKLRNVPFGTPGGVSDMLASLYGFDRDTVYVHPAPLYHAAPWSWSLAVIRNGGTVIELPKFDSEALLTAIQKYRVTLFNAVPTMFVRLLKIPAEERSTYDLSSLRLVVHAAAPCAIPVKAAMIDWLGPIITEFYSGSEAAGMTVIDSHAWMERKGSVGPAVWGRIHISNDGLTDLPPNEVGTVWFEGGKDFEYHGEPEKTKEARTPQGWGTLGDLGHVDEEGYLYLSERRSDLIISGGVNIYPREVEAALALHPAVADVGVIGLPDDEMGQRVHAVIQLEDPSLAGEELATELISFVRGQIAHFKAPRAVEFCAELPRLPTGKLLRRKLMEGR